MRPFSFIGRRALAIPLGIALGTPLAAAVQSAPAQAQVASQWQFTGSMATGHNNWWNSGFVQLPDGRVMAISGSSGPGTLTSTAEIYDTGTGQWRPAGTLNDARYAFGQPSVLPDGDVLVAGGHDVNVNDYATAELYNPATNQWTFTGSLNTARRYPVQVELANGEVLVATGSSGPPTCTRYLSSAELYDPSTGQWTYTGSTLVPRESAAAIRLKDGRVLMAGGYNGSGPNCTDAEPVDTEIYDPSTGQWSFAGNLPHGWLGGAMVLLPDGRVLMVDGSQIGSGAFAEAVIFNPATDQWTGAAPPILPRSGASATLLPDGDVLVSQGGETQSEIYDPTSNTWSLDATTLDTNNGGHTFLLPNGNVLLAGGGNNTGPSTTAELYTPASSASLSYVAMGDSYSSGEGTPPFFPGTDGPSDFCHRSKLAYSQVLGQAYGITPGFYACSGAQTANIISDGMFGEPAQINGPGVNTASLITISIGGNDAGFKPLLFSCIEHKLTADLINAQVISQLGPVSLWLGLTADPSCADSQPFVDSANNDIDDVLEAAKRTYQALLAKTSPTDTSIIAADYPHIFPDSQSEQSCAALSYILTSADEQFFNQAADHLDGVLQDAAAQAGVNFVDVRSAFGGHAVCGSGGAWINGISLASGSGSPCTLMAGGQCLWSGFPIVGSFHPNSTGQSSGYAAPIEAYINAAADKTPEGFPANPQPSADPPSSTTVPSVSVGALDVQPVTQGTTGCEGTYQAGQTLTVDGDGFTPGANVSLYVTSPGLGATAEQQVGSATADSSGNVSATIRIPLTATGFTPSGASAGLVFIDAIGTGAGGTQADDVASAGLARHAGSCGTVEPYPFTGFYTPVANPPAVNSDNAGRTIPVKFSLTDSGALLNQVLAAGYPQSAPVSCTSPADLTTGDPASATSPGSASPGDNYTYLWQTDSSWTGCRELIVKLVDGTYHRAVFNFG